jgi:hypothetical protein
MYIKYIEYMKEKDFIIIFTNQNKIEFEYNKIKKIFIDIDDIKSLEKANVYSDNKKTKIDSIITNIFRKEVKDLFN